METTTTRPPRPELKTVTVDRIVWTIVSANERSATHMGRHFFACRCSPKHHWSIDEMSQAKWSGSKLIGRVGTALETRELSRRVRVLTSPALSGEVPA